MAIKSNSYIARLSQDHHLEHSFCKRIEKGIELDVSLDRIRNYVSFFWEQHLRKHFLEEEQLLFKSIDDVFCTKGKEDHISIISEIEKIVSGNNVGKHNYLHLVSSIYQHINFEERVLFPHLELLLPEEELKNIQERLSQSHLDSFEDDFSDEFWQSN
ncbi:hypothetical protein [Pedobacter arcticus]|uniref:hypothetical protein n=1 Tax=Pedobacter arcticus TaxID=752140 RepID=UPI0002F36C21|nr:hypothetical protein [Pedobacter arcticus]